MEAFYKVCSAFDTFSVTFSPSLDPNNKKVFYKSILGGIITIFICIVGLCYSINLMMKWFNNEMIMKVSSQKESGLDDIFQSIIESFHKNIDFEVQVMSNKEQKIMSDPFKIDELIMLPLLLNPITKELSILSNPKDLQTNTLSISLIDSYNSDYILIFVSCLQNSQLLREGQACANQEKAHDFFSLTGLEFWTQKLYEKINLYTKEQQIDYQYSTQFLNPQFPQLTTLNIIYSLTEIRFGIFQNSEQYLLVDTYAEIAQISSGDYLETYFDYYLPENTQLKSVFGAIWIASDLNFNHIIAEYPTINEVFASIGSTFQVMLLVKYLLFIFNRWRMVEEFKKKCQEIYFPELKKVTQKGKGKQRKYYLNHQELELKSYREFTNYINAMFEEKLCYFNLLYEISRIQILLSEIIPPDSFKLCIQKKAALNLLFDQGCYKIINNMKTSYSGLDKDFLDPQWDPFILNYSSNHIHENISKKDNLEKQLDKDQKKFQLEGKDRDKTKSSVNANEPQYRSEDLFSNIELQLEDEHLQQSIPVSP